MAILLQDDFNRANNSSVVGNPVIGPPSTVAGGGMGISANQLYCTLINGTVVWDLGTPNVELTVTASGLSSARTVALEIGWVSTSDFWAIQSYDTVVCLVRYINGVMGQLAVVNRPNASATAQLKISYHSGVLRAYCDGIMTFYHIPDVPITSTKVGVRMDHLSVRADDLLAIDSTAPVTTGFVGKTTETLPVNQTAQFFTPSFAYQGHDTKLQDQAAGS